MNGQVYNVKDMRIGENAPPMHPNCRCSVAAYMDAEKFDEWLNTKSSVDYEKERGIMSERNVAGDSRRSYLIKLSETDKAFIEKEIKAIGADVSKFVFRDGAPTGYSDEFDVIYVSSQVFPAYSGSGPIASMSVRAVLAHEYYGHYMNRGTRLGRNTWKDEYRAHYQAAIKSPGLTDKDKQMLMNAALKVAMDAGVNITPVGTMRRILYGY